MLLTMKLTRAVRKYLVSKDDSKKHPEGNLEKLLENDKRLFKETFDITFEKFWRFRSMIH